MDKIVTWIKLTWAAVIAAPIVAPLLDLLHHRSVLVLLAGFVGYSVVPSIQGLSPAWRDNLGQFVFWGTLLLSGRFTVEGIMQARLGLPRTTQDYLKALLTELLSPTPDTTAVKWAAASSWPPLRNAADGTSPVAFTPLTTVAPTPRPTLPLEEASVNG